VGNRAVLSLDQGDRVTHDAWGLGTVVDTRGTGEQSQAQIDFGSAGVKWLVLRYAAWRNSDVGKLSALALL